MKKIHFIGLAAIFTLLASCSTVSHNHQIQTASNFIQKQEIISTSIQRYPKKQAKQVAFFNQRNQPKSAYRIIGIAKVYKKNILGMERKANSMENKIKSLAASIGGDGIIDLQQDEHGIKGTVIVFQKIML